MNWKKHLSDLEKSQRWDEAIEFMQIIIGANPDDMHAYIYMNFLLMNILAEEDYDDSKHDYYAELLLEYFNKSYAKFSNNAEYLFCSATTAVFSPWFMGLTAENYEKMFARAIGLEPENLLYQKTYYLHLDRFILSQQAEKLVYAKLILQENSPLIKEWGSRLALGEYLKDIQTGWAKDVLDWEIKRHDPQIVWKAYVSHKFWQHKQREETIEFMQTVVATYPNDMQAYMYLIFILMDLLVHEKYKQKSRDYYIDLLRKYYNESYAKFANDAEYLFQVGMTIAMDTELADLTPEQVYQMLTQAIILDPSNVLYQSAEYLYLNPIYSRYNPATLAYAQAALQNGANFNRRLSWEKGFDDFSNYLKHKIFNWATRVTAADVEEKIQA